MCNLYSVTKSQQAIRDLVKAIRDLTGNLPSLPAIFPNGRAPVVRVAPDGVRELTMMLWGFPPPAIPGSKPRNLYLTNVRNTDSRYWRTYLTMPEYRCLVPVTSFAEPDNNQGPRSIWTWFAQDENRPLMFIAWIWREWEGDRGTKTGPDVGTHTVFSFLTTDASEDVKAIHPDATPVLLLDEEAREMWMNAPWELAQTLQRPPPPGAWQPIPSRMGHDGVLHEAHQATKSCLTPSIRAPKTRRSRKQPPVSETREANVYRAVHRNSFRAAGYPPRKP
jgi:putative SOS response-associated peptidase YedK